jgi:hypothetical protein
MKLSVKRQILKLVISCSILLYPLSLLYFSNPNTIETDQSLCPSKLMTGLPCPGCGITKSMLFFYQANFTKSLHYHLFGPLLISICVLVFFITITELILSKKIYNSSKKIKYAGYTLAFSLGLYHFFRLTYFIFNNSIDEILRQSVWR